MSEEELAAIEELAKKATPGPWFNNGGINPAICASLPKKANKKIVSWNRFQGNLADPKFIAASRTDIPALVAEVRRLRDMIAG